MTKRIHWHIVMLLMGAAFALIAVGCGSSDSANGGNGDNPYIQPADQDNTGPGTEEANDNPTESDGSGLVIDPPGDEDIDDEVWRPECTEDRDCAGDKYCDTEANICRWRKNLCEECSHSRECGVEGDGCIPHPSGVNVCGQYCDGNVPCLWYNPVSQDFEPDHFECVSVAGFSEQQCRYVSVSGGADRGQACCVSDDCRIDDLGRELVCGGQPRMCRISCHEGGTCPEGQACKDTGLCEPGCNSNGDCSEGEVCLNNECIIGDCAEHIDCYPERICDLNTLECVAGCVENEGCLAFNECIDGQCVERVGCRGTYQCKLNENCTKEGVASDAAPEDRGVCYDPRLAAGDENPAPDGHTPQLFCKACEEQAQNSQECGGQGTHCVEFQDQEGAAIGQYCLIPVDCKAQERDDDGNFVGWDEGTQECPRGYTCMKVNSGQLQGKYCSASCWKPEFDFPE